MYNSSERKIRNTWRRHWLRKAHRLALSNIYEVFMQLVILVNMVLMLVEYILTQQAKANKDTSQGKNSISNNKITANQKHKLNINLGFLEADILDGVTSQEMNANLALLQKQDAICDEKICMVNVLYWIDMLFLFIYVFDVVFKVKY